jgi:hypothetical protein
MQEGEAMEDRCYRQSIIHQREENLRYVRPRVLSLRDRFTLNALLALCTILVASPAFSQQASAVDSTVSGPSAAGENPIAQRTESSSREDQELSAMPDAPSTSQHLNSSRDPLSFGERSRIYARSIFSPYTLIGPALGAGIGQAENEPPEWGQGGEGYARRFASGVGRHAIAETIRFGVAAADGEDPEYHRSTETGVWPRAKHVVVETFTSQTTSGNRIPAYSRFAGIYGAAFISNMWYPGSRATAGWALRRGSTALGASIGFHLFEEFVPRKYFKSLHVGD